MSVLSEDKIKVIRGSYVNVRLSNREIQGLLDTIDDLRQHLAAANHANLELTAWKESATVVMNKLPSQEIAKELDMPLGTSVSESILSGIRKLKAQLAAANNALKAV